MSGNDGLDIRRKRWGRRKGRPLNKMRSESLDIILDKYGIDVEKVIQSKDILSVSEILDEACSGKEIWLEVGFGNGEHILTQAMRNPDVLFIGCEPFINGIAALAKDIVEQDVKNIRIWNDDAHFLIEKMPDDCISRAFVLFPDPWPKAKHAKRRFIRQETLGIFSRIMKSGAILRMATDVEDLAQWMLEQAREHPDFQWCKESQTDWNKPPEDWVQTRYQTKGFEAGRQSHYIFFERKDR